MTKLSPRGTLLDDAIIPWGRPVALVPMSWQVLTAFFSIVGVSLIAFLASVTFVRKETATGVLSLSGGELRVLPLKYGIVDRLYVNDGQAVSKDQPLIRISTEQMLMGGTIDQHLLAAISNEEKALRAQLMALDHSAPLERQALATKLATERNQLNEMKAEFPTVEERRDVARRIYHEGVPYADKGVISRDYQRQRQYDYLAQEQTLASFQQQLQQLIGQIAQDQTDLDRLPSDEAQARALIVNNLAALDEKRTSATGSGFYILTSPVAGHITALQAKVGQPVESSPNGGFAPLMTIVPTDSTLQADIYVPSSAIGLIKVGQQVRLLYDAFPFEQFGVGFGKIAAISTVAYLPNEVSFAVAVTQPVYRVTVHLAKATISAYGVETPLRPSMSFKADLIVEEESFLEFLLDPLLASKGRLFAG